MTFDPAGRLRADALFYADGSLNQRLVLSYDERGRVSVTQWDDPHTVAPGKTTFNYDGSRSAVEQSWYDKGGHLYSIDHFTYKRDSFGNWIERSKQSCRPPAKKGEPPACDPATTEHRRIIYFDPGR